MKKSVIKVPFGPAFTLYEGEFYAVARHRVMLFFYFGLVCMILFTSLGRRRELAEPELILGIAALEVLAGLWVLVLCKYAAVLYAGWHGRDPYVHLGWVLVATVTAAVGTAEVLDPFLLGAPRSSLAQFALKLVFYLTITELLTSIMMQYTLGYILADLRKQKAAKANRLARGRQPDAAG